MKAEIKEAILRAAIPTSVGDGDTLYMFNELSIEQLVKDIQKLIKKANEPEKDEGIEKIVDGVILEMNNVWGSDYKLKTDANRKFIRGRLNDGHTMSEILLVISTLWRQWGTDTHMSQYLRPITVFAPSKFEGYLNQALRLKSNKDNMIYVADSFGHKRRITKTQFEAAEVGFFTRLD